MKLDGRRVLVTGASKGIGAAIARGLADEGAVLAVHYGSDEAGARRVAEDLPGDGGHIVVGADLRDAHAIDRMFDEIHAAWEGRLDVLVNNAALTGWTPVGETTATQWDAVLDTNLRAVFLCSQRAAAMMRAGGSGTIVNVSSNVAQLGVRHLAAYASSKGGLHALTRQLAVELAADGIRVNTFAPGPTRVERNLEDDRDYATTWQSAVPLGRVAEPEEMVGPAVFLAGDDSSFVTGQVLFVDGGWSIAGTLPSGYFDAAAAKRREGDG